MSTNITTTNSNNGNNTDLILGANDWPCPQCTFLNINSNSNKCLVCAYELKNNNNNNNSKSPTTGLIRNAFNTISNDLKTFLNGITNSNNNKTNNAGNTSSDDDVIEIDPKTNKPITNKPILPNNRQNSNNQWTCKTCTFAANPTWSEKCDICATDRNNNFNLNANSNNSKKIPSSNDLAGLTIYDQSLNEDIYDYARIWSCPKCTYINFKKDKECELCLNPRNNINSYNNKENNNQNNSNNSSSNVKIDWICKICSHKNKSSRTTCLVCLNIKDINLEEEDDDDEVETASTRSTSHRSQKARSTIKTYANATCQAEKIWNNILKYCKQQGHKFVDDSFPPCDKSLFIDPMRKPENLQHRGIQWLSPEFIRTHSDEYHLKWSVYNEPKFNDIKQGLLGNCWLLSGLAVIIEKPEMLKRIIITKDYNPQGCYQVRLCLNGEWQTVIVDDLFPCDTNGCLIYSQASRKQLWVPLIEKAMAKLNGNYESLIAGQTVEGLSSLTGYPCDSIRLESINSSSSSSSSSSIMMSEDEIDLDMIWARLVSMKDYGYSMGASCGRTDIKDDSIFTSKGLLPRHAYSVLNVKEINGNRLIQLRNPWGRYTWTGDWSDHSSKWTPELRKQCGLKPMSSHRKYGISNGSHSQNDNHFYNHNQNSKSTDGVFWMSFQDFSQYFCSIDICKTRLDWYENRMSGYFNPEGTREMQAYHLVIFETSQLDIGLFHKSIKNRRENSDLDLCFVVMRTNGQRNCVGKFMFASKHSVRKFIGCEAILEPGEYIIVPFSFNFWYTNTGNSNISSTNSNSRNLNNNTNNNNANNLYNLVLHSPKVFFLEQEMHAAFLLADTLIRFCISKGNKTNSGLENACIYTLTKGFAGIVVVAENYNERAYLHVELDCEKSNNVVSTRQALITKDSVQPLHRQVLIVLTHLEGTTGYSIQYSIKYRLSSNPYLNTWPGNEGQMVTNIPSINKQTFGLHAPRSAFD